MFKTIIFYNLIVLCSTVSAFLADRVNKNFRMIFNFILFLTLLLPMALRFNIGTDYSTYNDIFYEINNNNYTGSIEYFYFYINRAIYFVGLEFEWLIFLTSAIVVFSFCFSCSGKGRFIFILFFCLIGYLYYFSNIRTSLVHAGMIFFIFNYYFKFERFEIKQKIYFIFFVLLLSLMHYSASLLLVFLLVDNEFFRKILSRKSILFLFVLTLFSFFYFSDSLLIYFVNLFGYSHYLNSEYFAKGDELGSGIGVFIKITPAIYFLSKSSDVFKLNKRYVLVSFSMILYVVFTFLAIRYNIVSRIAVLFSFSYPLAMLILFELNKSVRYKLYLAIITIFWIALFEKYIIDGASDKCRSIRISPYVSIFNKEDDKSLGVASDICSRYE